MTLSDGSVIPASGCTSDSITPVLNEFAVGKSLSCTCGGDDASTQYICGQQPGTVLDISFWPSGASGEWSNGNASAKVYERAGLYSAVRWMGVLKGVGEIANIWCDKGVSILWESQVVSLLMF